MFFVGFISAQEITIIDALTSELIAGVSLYNQTKDRNTTSDENGKCSVTLFDEKDIIGCFPHLLRFIFEYPSFC